MRPNVPHPIDYPRYAKALGQVQAIWYESLDAEVRRVADDLMREMASAMPKHIDASVVDCITGAVTQLDAGTASGLRSELRMARGLLRGDVSALAAAAREHSQAITSEVAS